MNSPKRHIRKPPRPVRDLSSSILEKLVLCVDDDVVHLNLYRVLLKGHGYAVVTCTDGNQALEVFRTRPVRLAILDYAMPQMNGAEVARAMRLEKPNVPIVMLSGQTERPSDVGNAVNAYIVKGQHPSVLLGAIQSLIARQNKSSQPKAI